MTQRITMKQLEKLCNRINKVAGTPLTYCDKVGQMPFKANIGHFHIDAAYSGVRLVQTCNEGDGIRSFTGYLTKRELFYAMHAFIEGLLQKESIIYKCVRCNTSIVESEGDHLFHCEAR